VKKRGNNRRKKGPTGRKWKCLKGKTTSGPPKRRLRPSRKLEIGENHGREMWSLKTGGGIVAFKKIKTRSNKKGSATSASGRKGKNVQGKRPNRVNWSLGTGERKERGSA